MPIAVPPAPSNGAPVAVTVASAVSSHHLWLHHCLQQLVLRGAAALHNGSYARVFDAA
jgi:hypothetical protein